MPQFGSILLTTLQAIFHEITRAWWHSALCCKLSAALGDSESRILKLSLAQSTRHSTHRVYMSMNQYAGTILALAPFDCPLLLSAAIAVCCLEDNTPHPLRLPLAQATRHRHLSHSHTAPTCRQPVCCSATHTAHDTARLRKERSSLLSNAGLIARSKAPVVSSHHVMCKQRDYLVYVDLAALEALRNVQGELTCTDKRTKQATHVGWSRGSTRS